MKFIIQVIDKDNSKAFVNWQGLLVDKEEYALAVSEEIAKQIMISFPNSSLVEHDRKDQLELKLGTYFDYHKNF